MEEINAEDFNIERCRLQVKENRPSEIRYKIGSGEFPVHNNLIDLVTSVLLSMPEEDADYLLYDMNIEIVQILSNTVFRYRFYNREEKTFVCFTSDLCSVPDHHAKYIIAHELAHVKLGHSTRSVTQHDEDDADQLAFKWGFEDGYKAWKEYYHSHD